MAAAFAIQSGSSGENNWRACGAVFGNGRVAAYTVREKTSALALLYSENIYLCSRSVAIRWSSVVITEWEAVTPISRLPFFIE